MIRLQVLSVFEYGSAVHYLTDTIHNEASRIATGSFRSTQVESLSEITDHMSLNARREIKLSGMDQGLRYDSQSDYLFPIKND